MKDTTGKDFLGAELVVGDEVAYIQKYYSKLVKGKIVKLTPFGAQVERNGGTKFCTAGQMIKVVT